MSVGIPEIDEDHKQFASLINDLNRSIVDRVEVAEIRHRLQLIIDDAVQHFVHEERLFKEWQYADSESHAGLHAQTIDAMRRIFLGVDNAHLEGQWIEAGLEIKAMLIDHILMEDVKYTKAYRMHRDAVDERLKPG